MENKISINFTEKWGGTQKKTETTLNHKKNANKYLTEYNSINIQKYHKVKKTAFTHV